VADPKAETQVFGPSADDRRAVECLYRAFSEHNPDLLDEAVTQDWQDIPLARRQASGREGMKPPIRAFGAAFPDAKVTIDEIIGAPCRAAVRAGISGAHGGEWFGVPASATRFVLPIHEFHRLENGRLTHTWHPEDWFGWLRQVGALGSNEEITR
jgi:predicted ester cyclase